MKDFLEANELYHQKGWTDGLPIIPPTEELVGTFLKQVGLEPGASLGVEPVRGRVITAEKVAINAIMAGCLPQYLGVVLAAVSGMLEDRFNLHAMSVSTGGAAVLAVVSGPVARELGFNSGVSLFGPGPRPNATVGRAIRLILMNVTGAVPGGLDRSTFGHSGRFSYCIAEAEDASPWEPLHVERGLPRKSSGVTVFAAMAPWQMSNHVGNTPEAILTSLSDVLKAAGPGQGEVIVLLGREHLGYIAAAGWSKQKVREYLVGNSQRTYREWLEGGRYEGLVKPEELENPLPACRDASAITILVGGGEAGGFSCIIPMWSGGTNSRSVTKPVTLRRKR